MGPSGRITHVIGYIGYIALFVTDICRFCIWVELSVQNFREKCRVTRHSRVFRGLTSNQRIPRFGVSQI